jgi:hypothetical protein
LKKIKNQDLNKIFEEKKDVEITLWNMKINILNNAINCINNTKNNDAINSCINPEKISLESLNK